MRLICGISEARQILNSLVIYTRYIIHILNFYPSMYDPKGRSHNYKTGKLWTLSKIGSILDIFEFENILMAKDPPGLTS